ncbi:sulfatase-like hydrolase/transferase [Kriegella sp. EG-1]|nr:sulfatase-like hydrolase/transferase [Flavobacteriaceae bacterium EG-1]
MRIVVFGVLFFLLLFSCGENKEKAEVVQATVTSKKPNIVLLFVDDWGWADVGFRNTIFHTPNIDQLKKDGLNFERAYIATPTCSPSRASLLTGKEPVRFQMTRHIIDNKEKVNQAGGNKEFNLWPKDPVQRPSRNWLPLEEVTYAERLKDFGYYNMFIGKWHLGEEKYHPIHQGFDAQFGTTNAGHPRSYYPPFFKKEQDPMGFANDYKDEYLTDVLTEGAEKFISEYDKKQPFMLSMWYYSVHGPFVGRKDWLEKYKAEGLDDDYAEYAAMVSVMDESVGRVRKALVQKGISENTVVILLSDQGGKFTNAPLSGGKIGNTLGEGGARVPFIVNYPGVTKSGTTSNTPVQSVDLYPTLVEIASGKECNDNQINGKSIMPLLKGEEMAPRNLYFFRSYEDQYASIVSGDWKLVKYHSGKFQLFNVAKDISEKSNLIDVEFHHAATLKTDLQNWETEAVPLY